MEASQARGARRPLGEALADPSFTPRRSDVPALVDLLDAADDERARDIERALERVGPAALPVLTERWPAASAALRARLVRALGRLAPADPAAIDALLPALTDLDPKTRRSAAITLGKHGAGRVAAPLLAAAEASHGADRRPLVEALGKQGDAAALAWLRALDPGDDRELARLRERALLTLERTLGRDPESSEIVGDVALPGGVEISLHCRPGVESVLLDEVEAHGLLAAPRIAGPGVVRGLLRGPLAQLWRARCALDFALDLGGAPLGAPDARPRAPARDQPRADPAADPLVRAVVQALTTPVARQRLAALTRGPIRYRLAWAAGGHRRAETWAIAAAVRDLAPELVNDPTATTWEIAVLPRSPGIALEAHPRRLADPRFTYRSGDIPAASHPTIAAALARLAGARPDDVVWDPFVGSGLELCERARLGPYARLIGSDLDPRALPIARQNLDAAGAPAAELQVADALQHRIDGGVTCILTNPPLGRRLHRGRVDELLAAFLTHAATVLRPGGRLVWITPQPGPTGLAARRAGLALDRHLPVDLGGLHGEIEVWRRP